MTSPEKELRFTRARQSVTFWVLGLLLLLGAAGMGVLSWWQLDNPPSRWWAVILGAGAVGAFLLAWRLTRHAYLLLSPVGVEIFPFWNPVKHFQLLTWGSVAAAEFSADGRWLTLTMAGYEDAKVILTLDPIPRRAVPLLEKAVLGVMEKRGGSTESGEASEA